MRKLTRALFWFALLVLVLVALAAVAFWAWFFAPKAQSETTQRYGEFRKAWRAAALEQVEAGRLTAGVAAVDITPPVGTPLGGYGARHGRPSTGVHDRLYAKALVLDNRSERIAIVTCDLIGVSRFTLLRWFAEGKVEEVPRSRRNNYRMFRPEDIERIRAYAQAVDLPAQEHRRQGKLFEG